MFAHPLLFLSASAQLLLSQSAFAAPAISPGAPERTTSGLIVGHADPKYPAVSEYLGIPFAQPPLGELRFAPPVRYASVKEIVADKQPLSCLQKPDSRNTSLPQPYQNIAAENAFANHTSEDCLYLNVWTKHCDPHAELKPVIIWFYGGGFHAGGAADDTEQGGIFADEQDIVMVNFNYRLGLLGFSGAPDLRQNVGLLDQRLAVEWVRDNIAAFGGDPSRITIWGHSAGGASVDYYTYAWLEDPIVAGTIIMSGTTTSFGRRSPSTGVVAWDKVSTLVGCGNPKTVSNSDILHCMREKGIKDLFEASQTANEEILASLPQLDKAYGGITGIFSPTVDNKTVFENYTILGHQEKFIKVPVLTGNNDDEGCLFAERGQIPAQDIPMLTTEVFTCPVYHVAEYRVKAGVPAWKYLWVGGYPNLNIPLCSGKPWHGSEVNVIFGSSVIASEGYPATAKELSDARFMRHSLAAFAANPHGGVTAQTHWTRLNSNPNDVNVLAGNKTMLGVENVKASDSYCSTVLPTGGPIY